MRPHEPGWLKTWIRFWTQTLKRIVTEPRDELNRWERRGRLLYDLGRYGVRKLREDRAPQMAAALSYRTLFGLLPVLVVGTLIVRAVGGLDDLRSKLGDTFAAWGLDDFRVTTEDETSSSLGEWLLGLIDQVENVNLTALTWVGVAVLVYSAISLVVEVENSFNTITHSPRGRRWSRRLPIYWTVLTLGPIAVSGATFVASEVGGGLAPLLGFLGLWIVMGAVYRWMPNTRITFQAAFLGAFASATLLTAGGYSLGAYVGTALSVRQLYGSLGIIPLFMLWVYLMWLAILFGLEVGIAFQRFKGRSPDEALDSQPRPVVVDPVTVLAVMRTVAAGFDRGQPVSRREIAETTAVEERIVEVLLHELEDVGAVLRVEGEDSVTLARPADQIHADELLRVAFGVADAGGLAPSGLLGRLRDAQLEAAHGLRLSATLAETAEA